MYVTYESLFAYTAVIVSIVGLVVAIYTQKKK